MSTAFDETYFMRGQEAGVSNYTDYRWQPEITVPCVRRMMAFLGAVQGESVTDFGCSRGYYVKAMRTLGFEAYGYDISSWAIDNCHPDVTEFVSNGDGFKNATDWIVAKDVAEHIPFARLMDVIDKFLWLARKGVLIIVPLVWEKNGPYLNPADRSDATHVIAWTLPQWLLFIQERIDSSGRPWTVQGGYKLPGVKQAADPYIASTGFITIRKIQS